MDQIIDWDLSKFDLNALQTKELPEEPPLTPDTPSSKTLTFSVTSNQELFSTRETHQKDFISSEMTVGINTYAITVSIILRNNSESGIKNVKFRVNFPPALKLLSTTPKCILERKDQSLSLEIGDIDATQARRCMINFFPSSVKSPFTLDGIIQYKSAGGFARIIRLEAIEVAIDVPLVNHGYGTPEIVSNMMEDPKMVKILQGLGCPDLYDMNQAHTYLESVTRSLGFDKIEGMDGLPLHTSFFLGTSMNNVGGTYKILVSPQVSNRVLKFYVCCPYEMIGYSVLWNLSMKLQEKLRIDGLLPQDQYLVRMNCIACNNLLEIFPPAGEPVACKICQTIQIPF
ncbi:MAG: hypothetical protein KAR20_25750 [Candidatus Heimdallarchaeota archaeon]|nr:hypothetical protein [Candidatus Heimdallarchaeota archaeon]